MRRIIGQRGFTLIELVVIILITAIIAFVMIPRSDLTGNRAASAARKLLSDIRYAQQLANTTQSRSGVAFAAGSYTVFTNNSSGTPATDPLKGGNYVVNMTGDFAGVTLTMNNIDNNIVRFDSLGVPYEDTDGAQNTLDGNETIDVKVGATVVKTITIVPSTGQVTMN